jgi:hypothetical protein
MVSKKKLLRGILLGPKNVRFEDMVSLVEAFGFRLSRINGSHHIFAHPLVPVPVNLQDFKGQAKPYQIRQFLRIVERYNLTLGEDE